MALVPMLERSLPRIRFLLRHPFTRDSAVLQIANVIGKIVGLAAGILYANLLGPEAFGFYSLAIALAGFLNIFQVIWQ